MTRPFRIGLMGCGVVAGYGHLPAMAQVADLRLQAVYDPDPKRAAAAAPPGVVAAADLADFFAAGLDAVTITSPAPAHLANVLACAEHRLPVLCEKPLAMNEAEAQAMIQAMRDAGAPLYTAFCYRYAEPALTIRRLVADGAIGAVRSLRLIYNWDNHGKYEGRDPARGLSARREGRMLEGGPMVDCGTHQIDLARWWLDSEVARFEAHGAWVDEHAAPDHMWLHLDHAIGAHTCVEMSYSYTHTAGQPRAEFVYELIGTDGLIRYDRERREFELRQPQGSSQLPFAGEKSFVGLYHAWAQSLRTGEVGAMCTAESAMITTRIARTATDQVVKRRGEG